MSTTIPTPDFTVSARAQARIAAILQSEPLGAALRVAVKGGGCSGFQYDFAVSGDQSEDDLAIGGERPLVIVDPVSLEYLRGAELDFVDDLIGRAFKIRNPNATASCGCGVSFAL